MAATGRVSYGAKVWCSVPPGGHGGKCREVLQEQGVVSAGRTRALVLQPRLDALGQRERTVVLLLRVF